MLIFKLTRVVFPCARGFVNIVKGWKILGSSTSVIRLLPSVRHQHDNNTRFEKAWGVDNNLLFYASCAAVLTHFSTPIIISQENIFTIPNVLSLGRIALSPALGYLVLSDNYRLALTLFMLAGVSDMVGTKIKYYTYQ